MIYECWQTPSLSVTFLKRSTIFASTKGASTRLFDIVGLVRASSNQSALLYDDIVLPSGWHRAASSSIARPFRQACAREDLLGQSQGRPRAYGVKSFEHAFDRLEDRCDGVLDLVPVFNKRYIRNDADWEDKLYPRLKAFLESSARKQPRLRVALDAHTTLAFAAGSVLNIKSGRHIELEQRTLGRRLWAADDMLPDANWPTLSVSVEDLDSNQVDLAVAFGITHDILNDVRRYIHMHLHSVSKLLSLQPTTGPSAQVVICGRHAFNLAQAAKDAVRREKSHTTQPVMTHIFVAAPNSLTFFLGQQQPALGRVRLYEHDFEGGRGGSYTASLTLPP